MKNRIKKAVLVVAALSAVGGATATVVPSHDTARHVYSVQAHVYHAGLGGHY